MGKQRVKDPSDKFNLAAEIPVEQSNRTRLVASVDFALKKSLADALCILAQTGPEGIFVTVSLREWVDEDGHSQMMFSPMDGASEDFLKGTWVTFKRYVDKICGMVKSHDEDDLTEYVVEDPANKNEFELYYRPDSLLSKLRYDNFIQSQNQTLHIDKEELQTLQICLQSAQALLERVENYGGYLAPYQLN